MECVGGPTTCLAGDVVKFLDDVGTHLVRQYFDPASEFSGAAFNSFAGGGDAIGHRNKITSDDLVAVTLLEVVVPGHAALEILDRRTAELSSLLTAIPFDVDLWDVDVTEIDRDSAAAQLWSAVASLDKIGWVIAGKLLARKRPRLLPVYDSVVKEALQPYEDMFWIPLREELQHQELRDRLAEVRSDAGLNDQVSLLRVLDVAVWMRNRRASGCRLEFTPCPNIGSRTSS
jgi:Family of unknown function (DUF6308)